MRSKMKKKKKKQKKPKNKFLSYWQSENLCYPIGFMQTAELMALISEAQVDLKK